MRGKSNILVAITLAIAGSLATATAAAQVITRFDLPVQPLADSLRAVAGQTNSNILFDRNLVAGLSARPLNANLTIEEALKQLLAGTGLTYRSTDEKTIMIVPLKASAAGTGANAAPSTIHTARDEANVRGAGSRDSDRERGDSTGRADHATPVAVKEDAAMRVRIEEIIVSAAKRDTRLQETALSLSVLDGEELDRRNVVSATDYLNSVPGVYMASYGLANQLVIRGLGLSVAQSPTAGAYLGDIPLSDALAASIIDIKNVDIARVEVLRGPQGTLYGAGAMGGAVRQIPEAPRTDRFESEVKFGSAVTDESDEPSYNATGVVNVPLIDHELAVRAAAYFFRKAGYVDLVSTPAIQTLAALTQLPVVTEKDTGGHEYAGVRAAVLFSPNDDFDMTLTLGYQNLDEDGRSELAISAKDYVFSVLATGREFRKQEFEFANLVANADLSWATLTSSSSWTRTINDENFSHSRLLPSATTVPTYNTKTGLSQEVRIATQLEGPVQFVGGGFYEDIEREEQIGVEWTSPNLAVMQAIWRSADPQLYLSDSHSDLQQLAFFGELSYQLLESLTMSAGGRWFDYERHDDSVTLLGVAPGVAPSRTQTGDLPAKEDGQVFKLGLSWQPGENTLLYTNWSQGFRLGKSVDASAATALFGNVCDSNQDGLIEGTTLPFSERFTLRSDRLDNIEVGGKFMLLDGRFSVNAAGYRIKWYDLPVAVIVPVNGLACIATVNGGEARSQGLELEAVLRATNNLELSLSGSLSDTEYLDDLAGQQGQRLPFAPKYNARLGLQYSFDVFGRKAFARSDVAYVSESATALTAPDVALTDPYHTVGMRTGIAFQRFSLELYGSNLTNENPLIGVYNLNRGWRLEPRTIGLAVNVDF